MAKTFDGPPTLERSGSERRGGAVSSLFPEGERVGVRGGALFNGKEGRGDFRKSSTKGGYILPILRRVSVPYKGNRRGCKDYWREAWWERWSSPCRRDGEVENTALQTLRLPYPWDPWNPCANEQLPIIHCGLHTRPICVKKDPKDYLLFFISILR